jgi:hypothetical protein
MGLFRWIRSCWKQQQRRLDHQVLFPTLSAIAGSRAHYLSALRYHLTHDPAWNVDYEELDRQDRSAWDEAFR